MNIKEKIEFMNAVGIPMHPGEAEDLAVRLFKKGVVFDGGSSGFTQAGRRVAIKFQRADKIRFFVLSGRPYHFFICDDLRDIQPSAWKVVTRVASPEADRAKAAVNDLAAALESQKAMGKELCHKLDEARDERDRALGIAETHRKERDAAREERNILRRDLGNAQLELVAAKREIADMKATNVRTLEILEQVVHERDTGRKNEGAFYVTRTLDIGSRTIKLDVVGPRKGFARNPRFDAVTLDVKKPIETVRIEFNDPPYRGSRFGVFGPGYPY